MSFGSGLSSKTRSRSTADGVSFKAALRGLNLRFGGVGFGFGVCASCSRSAMVG